MSELPVVALSHICSFINDLKTCWALEWVGKICPEIGEAVQNCFAQITEIHLSFGGDKEGIGMIVDRKGVCSFKCRGDNRRSLIGFRFLVERAKNVKKLFLDFSGWNWTEDPQSCDVTISSFFAVLKGRKKLRELRISVGGKVAVGSIDYMSISIGGCFWETAPIIQNFGSLDSQIANYVQQYPNLQRLELIELPVTAFHSLGRNRKGELLAIERYEDLQLLQTIYHLERLKFLGVTIRGSTSYVDWENRKVSLASFHTKYSHYLLNPVQLFPMIENSVCLMHELEVEVNSRFQFHPRSAYYLSFRDNNIEYSLSGMFPIARELTVTLHGCDSNPLNIPQIYPHLGYCLEELGKAGRIITLNFVGDSHLSWRFLGHLNCGIPGRQEMRGIVEEYNDAPSPNVDVDEFPSGFDKWGILTSTVMHPVYVESVMNGDWVRKFWVITTRDDIKIVVNIRYNPYLE